MARDRNAKTLSMRHDPTYIKRRTLFQHCRLWLSFSLGVGALIFLGSAWLSGHAIVFTKGPVAPAHSFIANNCGACHTGTSKGWCFFRAATNDACQNCHHVPDHHESRKPVPLCSSCHAEHEGNAQLVRVQGGQCVLCHRDLTKIRILKNNEYEEKNSAKIEDHIEGFNTVHPKLKTAFEPTPATIIFSHKAHLEKRLTYPAPYREEKEPLHTIKAPLLKCADCHLPAVEADVGPWPYSQEGLPKQPAETRAKKPHPDAGREFMLIPNFEQQCERCHDLKFRRLFNKTTDQKLFDGKLPHPQELAEVFQFMNNWFQKHSAFDSEALRNACSQPLTPRLVEVQLPSALQRNEHWVQECLSRTKQLARKKCDYCHQYEQSALNPPVVKKSGLKIPEMEHAVFNHQRHVALRCEECHTEAIKTDQSAQSLLPSIDTCRRCHDGDSTEAGHADNGCFLCHQYHDWPNHKSFPGPHTIEELTGRSARSSTGSK